MDRSNNETMNTSSKSIFYVWGATPAKAVFGPVQDIFPIPSIYSAILALISLVEEALTPEDFVIHEKKKIDIQLQEESGTVILDIRHTCISISTENNLTTLSQSIQMYIKESLLVVRLLCVSIYRYILMQRYSL